MWREARVKKGKAVICAVLGASLVVAAEAREQDKQEQALVQGQIASSEQENKRLKEQVKVSQGKSEREQEDIRWLKEDLVENLTQRNCQEAFFCPDSYHTRKSWYLTRESEEIEALHDSLQQPTQCLKLLK